MSRAGESTKREDRRALVAAGQRYHAAKIAYGYTQLKVGTEWLALFEALGEAKLALVHAAEVYAVGRRKASVEYGHKHYARSKKAAI